MLTSDNKRHRLPAATFAAFGATAACLVFIGVLMASRPDGSERLSQLMPELLALNATYDSSGQRLAHYWMLLVLASLAVVAWLAPNLQLIPFKVHQFVTELLRKIRRLGGLPMIVCIALIYYFLVPLAFFKIWVALIFCVICAAKVMIKLHGRSVNTLIWGIITAFLIWLIVPGLLEAPIYFHDMGATTISQIESHPYALVRPAAALASGQRFFEELIPLYGLLVPSVFGAFEKYLGYFEFADYLRLIQWHQVAFLSLAVASLIIWKGHRPILVLGALFLFATFLTTAGQGIWHPNQTGWRHIGFALVVFLMILMRRNVTMTRALVLGLACGGVVLHAIEIGIVVTISTCVFVAMGDRERTVIGILLHTLPFFTGVMCSFLIFWFGFIGAFGEQPVSSFSVFSHILTYTQAGNVGGDILSLGPNGENIYYVGFAFFILFHSAFIFLREILLFRRGIQSNWGRVRASLALIVLGWMVYYVNFPAFWNLWSILFLYSFLFIDFMDHQIPGRSIDPAPRLSLLGALGCALAIMIGIHAFTFFKSNYHFFLSPYWSRENPSIAYVSGVIFRADVAEALKRKAAFLDRFSRDEMRYITFNNYIVPTLSRRYQEVPYDFPLSHLNLKAKYEKFIEHLENSDIKFILIDSENGVLSVNGPRAAFLKRLRINISSTFRLTSVTNGWEVWEHRAE